MMAHYVISDIHGEADRFRALLEKISFSREDQLYILGDVIDRGAQGIELLEQIMEAPNMVMLLGNHEHMMLRYFSPDVTESEIGRWNRNRNMATKVAYLNLEPHRQQTLLSYLNDRPTHLELTVAGRRYYLVHGFPGSSVWDEVWQRPTVNSPSPVPGTVVLIGHTPVQYLLKPDDDERREWLDALTARGEHLRILHTHGFICLDCSSGYSLECRALACLRLEDMEEFYV